MPIIRASDGGETVDVPLAVINDERLSWKARGMLVYILNEPDGCVMSARQLCQVSTDGRESVRSGLAELIEAGYLAVTYREIEGNPHPLQHRSVIEYRAFETPSLVARVNIIRVERGHQRSNDPRYRVWREQVLELARQTCEACGAWANIAHHVNSYADHPDQRYIIANGAALCTSCHIAFHRDYGRGRNTMTQFTEWLGAQE